MSKLNKKLVPVSLGENETVKPFAASAKGNKAKSSLVVKKVTVPKSVIDKFCQTNDPSDIVTGEEPPLAYWKLLAEEKIKENENLKTENASLKRKLEDAEKEVETLEDMLSDAKKMAQYIEDLPDEKEEESDDDDD